MNVSFVRRAAPPDIEIIERKGLGHPDSLADGLAEELSREYSKYTLENFGAVLHHNFDKVGLLGGRSRVEFGNGRLVRAIRVLINGRVSERFADKEIPVRELVTSRTRAFLSSRFPKLDPEKDLEFHWNLSTGSSPGFVDTGRDTTADRAHWFAPRSLEDLRERKRLSSNDTSLGCAHAPFSKLEQFVLHVERTLNSASYKERYSWLGSDIKLMAARQGSVVDMTICVPQIADHVPNLDAYRANMATVSTAIKQWAEEQLMGYSFNLQMNTRDNYETPELYLTALGSSIESGDEGLVGRGNRANGLISTCRPYTMEGACGKNPVYHTGKVYSVLAQRIARQIHEISGAGIEVWVIGQSGRALRDPWKLIVTHDSAELPEPAVRQVLQELLQNITSITDDLLAGRVTLY